MDTSVWLMIAVATVAVVTAVARRYGLAAPLALVVVGLLASVAPFVPTPELEPEWILAGVLPPLLYSAAVSMPAMDFRRDLAAIGGLSVILVVVTAVVIGVVIAALLPAVDLPLGIAVGAIVSPTDAVATSVVRRLGVPPRIITVLEGESLLNDATALVLLRSALAATATSVSLWGVAGDFLRSVAIAVVIGLVVGWIGLLGRSRIQDPAANTIISFVVPFVAFLPAEHAGASGLVAAVAAGLVTGQQAPRFLDARNRMVERQNWGTVELLLEGGVFLTMGLQLSAIVHDVHHEHDSAWTALWLGALAAVLAIAVRAVYVVPLLLSLRRRVERKLARKEAFGRLNERLDDGSVAQRMTSRRESEISEDRIQRRLQRLRTRIRRYIADVDYLAAAPLGPREGTLLVWAGMRGAVTLAAAQTLPESTPERSLLVLIAFVVAVGTLLGQGTSLGWLVRRLGLGEDRESHAAERRKLDRELVGAAVKLVEDPELARPDGTPYDPEVVAVLNRLPQSGDDEPEVEFADEQNRREQFRSLRLTVVREMRRALLDAREDGTYASETLEQALAELDADELSIELKRHTG